MKIEIKTTLLQYFEMEGRQEIDNVIRIGDSGGQFKAVDTLDIGTLFENGSLIFVKDMQMLMSRCLPDLDGFLFSFKDMLDSIEKETNVSIKELYKYNIAQLFEQFKFLHNEITGVNKINEIEQNGLGGESSYEEKSAGIEVFQKYGIFILLDKLTGGDLTKHDEYKKLPYSQCFTKLLLDKDKAEFQKNLNEIYNRKHG